MVEANEDGTVGGSHQIMFDTVTRVDRTQFTPVPCFYQDNPFADRYRSLGLEVLVLEDLRAHERAVRLGSGRGRRTLDMIRAVQRRRRLLRESGIDLLHLNNSPHVGFSDWLPAGKAARVPVIVNAMGDAEPIKGGAWKRKVVASFDHYVPISTFMEAALHRQGVPPEKMTLIRAGVDVAKLRSSVDRPREEVRNGLSVESHQRLVVMVGNIREWKGQHVVIEALGRLPPETRERLVVAFVGAEYGPDDPYAQGLRDRCEGLQLHGSVRWLGSRADVGTLFAAADAGLHASITPEPFGLVMVECMAVGTPVIAAREGGAAEIVTPDTGWVHPGGDDAALAELLAMVARTDPDSREVQDRRAACLSRSEGFDVREMAEGVQAVWTGMLPRARG